MSERQRLSDTEQLEILALLEAVNTEHSAMRAARALAELMVISTLWANASPVSCPLRPATSSQSGAHEVACADADALLRTAPRQGRPAEAQACGGVKRVVLERSWTSP